jgi:archaellum component FlaF (FlaF/FlaG flagellin family)
MKQLIVRYPGNFSIIGAIILNDELNKTVLRPTQDSALTINDEFTVVEQNTTLTLPAEKLGLYLLPGDSVTITAQNVAGETTVGVRVAFNWTELS